MKKLFDKSFFYMLLSVIVILTIPILLNLAIFPDDSVTDPDDKEDHPNSDHDSDSGDDDKKNDSDSKDDSGDNKKKIYWGVDSANAVTKDVNQCVTKHFGEPEIWGRYLGDKKDVSTGLDKDEATFLHKQDIKILVIYNHFTDATGFDHGVKEAKNAIKLAKKLDVPDGVAIFGDIEPNAPVDSLFIEGWYDTLADSDYKPGIYGVFDEDSKLITAYNDMKKKAQKQTIVWTAYPEKGITKKNKAPKFKGEGPDKASVDGWQYGIDAKNCEIDTNLFKKDLLDYVWE